MTSSTPKPTATAHTTTVQNPRLRWLNALRQGEKPLMTFMAIPSVRMAQVVALTGLEAIIIDCEHGNIGDDSMHNAVAAISALNVSPLIRVRGTAPDILKRALDTGAHGLMVPMINTAEEAEAVVTYSKFPPLGLRGQGSFFPSIAHGLSIPGYMSTANETIILAIQIETKEGVANVDAIAAVPGIDFVFIGPNDLAQSLLGYAPAKGDEPVFVEAVEKIYKAAKANGKWCGRLVNDGAGAVAQFDKFEWDSLAITGDTKAIVNWYGDQIKAVREKF